MHKIVDKSMQVTLDSGFGVNASANTTVVAATGIAQAITKVLNKFWSLMPSKVSIHQVSAGATNNLNPQATYARQSDTKVFVGMQAKRMPATVIESGDVIVDQKLLKLIASVGTLTLHKKSTKPIALKIIAGFANAFLTLIYFLSPVRIKIPKVHVAMLNTMIYIDAYKITWSLPGNNADKNGKPKNPQLENMQAKWYIF